MKTENIPIKRFHTGCAISTALMGICALPAAADSDEWEMRATGQVVVGSYGGSDLRDSLYAAGAFIGGDYLEKGGFTLGYNYTEVEGKADDPGDFDTLEESTFYLGGKIHSYPDSLGGKLTWRLDGYFIKDEADVNVVNTMLGQKKNALSRAK